MSKRRIDIGKVWHLTSMEAYGEAEECMEAGVEISDQCAATIAALFHTSRSDSAMAGLSMRGTCEVEHLLEDIAVERRYCALGDIYLLDMLATWAINHD